MPCSDERSSRFAARGARRSDYENHGSFLFGLVLRAGIRSIDLTGPGALGTRTRYHGTGLGLIVARGLILRGLGLVRQCTAGSPAADGIGEWGDRSLRTFAVGAPLMFLTQRLTGGGRPGNAPYGNGPHASHWAPGVHDHGVSGHSFMGAIPFLSVARMSDNPWVKGTMYTASTLPALSRINDDAHFASQAFLGWWLAVLASEAVDQTNDGVNTGWRIVPLTPEHGDGLAIEKRW